jgi:hypothetical protein
VGACFLLVAAVTLWAVPADASFVMQEPAGG